MKFYKFWKLLENTNIKYNEKDDIAGIQFDANRVLSSILPKSNEFMQLVIRPVDLAANVYAKKELKLRASIKVTHKYFEPIKEALENFFGVQANAEDWSGYTNLFVFWIKTTNPKEIYSFLVKQLTYRAANKLAKITKHYLDQGIPLDEFGQNEFQSLEIEANSSIRYWTHTRMDDIDDLISSVLNHYLDNADSGTGQYRGEDFYGLH